MNIFILDLDPEVAANMLVPMHVGLHKNGATPKMAIEGLQMLATMYHERGWPIHSKLNGDPYSPKGHPFHRCSRWVRESPRNAWWLLRHVQSICKRYLRETGCRPSIQTSVLEAYTIFSDRMPVKLIGEPHNFAVADGIQLGQNRFTPTEAVDLYLEYYKIKEVT